MCIGKENPDAFMQRVHPIKNPELSLLKVEYSHMLYFPAVIL